MLVANPSSSGFTGSLFRDVVSTLSRGYDVRPIWPVNPSEARQRAIEAARDGVEVVAAMGGDGVVHHVGNGLVHTGTALGIIPAGTTNVAARIHGIHRDPRKAAISLLDRSSYPTRVAHIETDSEAGARTEYAMFSVGVGFDADVVEIAEQRPYSKRWFGSLHFARAAAGRVLGPYRRRAPDLNVTVGDDTQAALAVFVQIHDLYTYFGRLPMSLSARGAAGPAAAALDRLDPSLAIRLVGRLTLRRDIARLDAVRRWDGFDGLEVTSTTGAPFQADGEHLGHATRIAVRTIEDALLVVREPWSG